MPIIHKKYLISKFKKMIKNRLLYTAFLFSGLMLFSCQSLVDDINDNPNRVPVEDLTPQLFLTGAQLANINFQLGHLSRISGLYSGQLVGLASVYQDVYRYNISTAESNSSWDKIYVGVVANTRAMVQNAPDDRLLIGIAKVIEANALGAAASIFGDVPFSEINTASIPDPNVSIIPDPKFDDQISVISAIQIILDEAIASLQGAGRALTEDIHFGGDADKWIATAYTLKARFYMITREYDKAYDAASNGIMDAAGSFEFVPVGTTGSIDDKNQFWTMLNGARGGDIGSRNSEDAIDSYLVQLLDPTSAVYRGNSKTDETARSGYSYIEEADGDSNSGIIEQFEAQNIVSYEENALTLAEAGARAKGFDSGLGHLNDYRSWLATGAFLNANFSAEPYTYEAYDADDFMNGGIENADGIDPLRALIREVVEERYVSGFLTWMPFDDHRRLRKSDTDVVVPFPVNDPSAQGHVERLPYPSNELNANSNAPDADPGIFTKTAVNQ